MINIKLRTKWFEFNNYQDEDVRSEDIVLCSDDDGLVTDVVAKVSIDPFGIASGHRVVGGP